MSRSLFDEGLQPERTELAWRRTALSFGVAALIAFRLLSQAFGDPSWALPALVAIVAVGGVWLAARRRYVSTSAALIAGRAERMPSGMLLLIVSAMTMLIALGGLAAVLVVVWQRG